MPDSLLQTLIANRTASRIWQRDISVFAPAGAPAAVHDSVRTRLGWLDAPAQMTGHLDELRRLLDDTWRDGIRHVYLLGMGGSSLCAEVLRETLPPGDRGSSLLVLDTTDERAIAQATEALIPAETLFIVASKSGGTIEVSSLERYFRALMIRALGDRAGRHFVAITDPGTELMRHAEEHGYRAAFQNPADIGGRYSALSLFGLVPAELLDAGPARLLESGREMAALCKPDAAGNPGLALGAFLAGEALGGRDKLTLLLPPSVATLGLWIEQLVAESTGKNGRGILPVVAEPAGAPEEFGNDRAFVAVLTSDAGDVIARAAALEAAGHPVFRIEMTPESLGAEFFRWEFATAVAGAGIGVNPFDEPNVKSAKAQTQAQLEAYRSAGALNVQPPLEAKNGWRTRVHRSSEPRQDQKARYIALLDYLPADSARPEIITRIRRRLRRMSGLATTHGIGPRYLHSTGQYHKGGPNTGLFILLTAGDATATPVPEADYSFSVLKQAQALGDFEALKDAGRDVVHFHFDVPGSDILAELERIAESVRL